MASIDSIPLIHEDNRAFLKGERRKLAESREAIDNLAASMGIKASSACASGCRPVLGFGWGVILTVVGLIILVPSVVGVASTHPMSLEDIAVMAMLAVGMFFIVFGHYVVVQIFYLDRQAMYITQISKQLIAYGEIIEGIIIGIEQKQDSPQIIRYRFNAPSGRENYEGEYKLFMQKPLVVDQKVTILYLNRCAHLLL